MTKEDKPKTEGNIKEAANTIQAKLAENLMGVFDLVVSDRSDNFTSAVVFIGIGLALIVAAGLTWKAFA